MKLKAGARSQETGVRIKRRATAQPRILNFWILTSSTSFFSVMQSSWRSYSGNNIRVIEFQPAFGHSSILQNIRGLAYGADCELLFEFQERPPVHEMDSLLGDSETHCNLFERLFRVIAPQDYDLLPVRQCAEYVCDDFCRIANGEVREYVARVRQSIERC
jgi:hypothetical protein